MHLVTGKKYEHECRGRAISTCRKNVGIHHLIYV
jgi:hypothetical protein